VRAALFERLVAAEPDTPGHLVNFGVFEMEAGDYRAAAGLFEEALDLDPRHESGWRGLSEAAQALVTPG